MEIRPFRAKSDTARCLVVFDSNSPDFFAPTRRADFESFLASPEATVVVAEHGDAIVACAGYVVNSSAHAACLHWLMVARSLQRQGVGRYLLLYRLKEIGNLAGVEFVEADVPPHLAPFYAKNGLKPAGGTLHRMKLQVCGAS